MREEHHRREWASHLWDEPDVPMVPVGNGNNRAENPIDAIQRCGFGNEPETSIEELLPLREVLADAIDLLEPREKWIFEAVACGRWSFRTIAAHLNLSKSMCHNIYRDTCVKLQGLLADSPIVQEHLRGEE